MLTFNLIVFFMHDQCNIFVTSVFIIIACDISVPTGEAGNKVDQKESKAAVQKPQIYGILLCKERKNRSSVAVS